MHKSEKLYLVIILILSIGLIFTGCSNDSNSPNLDNQNTYTISGAVIGLENEGIKDVIIHFSNDDESVKTNSAGEWQKTGLSGEVEVTPVKEGYEFSPKSKKVSESSDDINFTVQNFIIIPETTKIINDEISLQIEQLTENQVIMNKNNDFVKSVKINDILVSGVTENTPFGMLRRVENKTIEGDSINFQTSMASLDQAIKKGNIHKEITLKQQDVITNEVLSSGVNIGAANNFSKEFSYQLDKIIYDNDGDHDTEYDQVVTKGNVAFGYKLILDMEIDSYKLKNFSMKSMVEGDQFLSISSGVSYSKNEDFRIAEIKFAPMTFPIPIPFGAFPLVITPNLGVDIGYSGSISSEVVTSTSLSQTIEGGANYNSSGWEPIKNLDLEHDFETPSLETGANFAIAAGPELTTMVYELAGPSSKLEGYSQLEADPLEEIWWELYGGINGSIGVKIEVFSIHIADYEKEIIDYRKLLAEANAVPVINSIDDKTIKEGENIEFKVSASDPNNDELTYSAAGDLTEKFNSETQTFNWTPEKGEAGNYTITFEVSDGKESDSESVNITVIENLENSPPVIDDLTNNISELQVTISASISDMDNNLSEAVIDWGDNNKTNINSGFDTINESHSYASSGSYTIEITATDSEGATASES
ncbi:MAG: PKD domain-containing protein, partial [bacterium]